MNCEKSYKRDLIKYIGMRELAKGRTLAEVAPEMHKLRRKTIAEIKQVQQDLQ